MRSPLSNKVALKTAIALALLLLSAAAFTQTTQPKGGGQIRIPNRAATPLFAGKQGKQKTEISFDPATHIVTLKLLGQDPGGYFIS